MLCFIKSSSRLAVIAGAVLALTAGSPHAQTKPTVTSLGIDKPESVIYIGNSFFYFNNGISGMVARILASADKDYKLDSVQVTISGSGFDWHDIDSYFRPNAVARYTIPGDNILRFNNRKRLFDVAITMDCSQCPVHPQLKDIFREQAKKFADTVRMHDSMPVFFMSWAYLDKPEMTEQIAEAYTKAGNDNKALVIPAGLAFARVVKERPDLAIYMPDKRHPTRAGTYLAALTTFAAVFRKSPVGLAYTDEFSPDVAKYLQTVAWETVQSYLGWQ
jgi:hypothetical protein